MEEEQQKPLTEAQRRSQRQGQKRNARNRGDILEGYADKKRICKALNDCNWTLEEEVKLLVDTIRNTKDERLRMRTLENLGRLRFDVLSQKPKRPGAEKPGKAPDVTFNVTGEELPDFLKE